MKLLREMGPGFRDGARRFKVADLGGGGRHWLGTKHTLPDGSVGIVTLVDKSKNVADLMSPDDYRRHFGS